MKLKQEDASLEPMKYKRGQHPNSQKNLKDNQFPKGYNGNREGYSLTAALKHALSKAELRDELVKSTIEGAIKREPTPFKEVWERVDGKIAEKHAILGDIVIEVVYKEKGNVTD